MHPLTGQESMAACMLSSVSSHCPNTLLRPYSCSILKVAGASHTHCLQPMQLTSSCEPRGERGGG
jgi:hypothetical protein